jgi:hypothetical protein
MDATHAGPVPLDPETPALSEGGRILNTFIAPSKTFNDLRRSAAWWGPFLLIAIVVTIFFYLIDRQVTFEQVSKNEIARSAKRSEQFEKLPPEQQEKQLRIAGKFTRYICYSLPILNLLFFVIQAAALMAVFRFAGAAVPFKRSLAIAIYSGLPGIIGVLLGIVSLFSGVDAEGFNINNPVASNPAYFMDPSGNRFVYGMASALDIFVIWTIILVGIGFSCNSKIKRSTAIMIVVCVYVAYKLIASGLGAAFS